MLNILLFTGLAFLLFSGGKWAVSHWHQQMDVPLLPQDLAGLGYWSAYLRECGFAVVFLLIDGLYDKAIQGKLGSVAKEIEEEMSKS